MSIAKKKDYCRIARRKKIVIREKIVDFGFNCRELKQSINSASNEEREDGTGEKRQ